MSNHEDSRDPSPYLPVDPAELTAYELLCADAERILAEALELVEILQRRDADTERWHPTGSDDQFDALMTAVGSRAVWAVIDRFDEVVRPDPLDDSDDVD